LGLEGPRAAYIIAVGFHIAERSKDKRKLQTGPPFYTKDPEKKVDNVIESFGTFSTVA
jgi:hypothetical protein